MNTISLVQHWRQAFGLPYPDKPVVTERAIHSMKVLKEEVDDELLESIEHYAATGEMVEILDVLIDIEYFLANCYIMFGLSDLREPGFREVHRSNMTKLGPDGKPVFREDGKVMKGPNYEPPNLKQFFTQPKPHP